MEHHFNPSFSTQPCSSRHQGYREQKTYSLAKPHRALPASLWVWMGGCRMEALGREVLGGFCGGCGGAGGVLRGDSG